MLESAISAEHSARNSSDEGRSGYVSIYTQQRMGFLANKLKPATLENKKALAVSLNPIKPVSLAKRVAVY